ncbi:MAG: hypothetical protein NZ528_00555 [Caldilineales bacterium]|nr:hypothetical protein [Caldilineales bacterium]MDW8317779.1 hypothetical protein [Anaerolineae bacterium]
MAQSVWHVKDIENVLRGVELACRQLAAHYAPDQSDAFQQGFLTALAATATSLGIEVNLPRPNGAARQAYAMTPGRLLSEGNGRH